MVLNTEWPEAQEPENPEDQAESDRPQTRRDGRRREEPTVSTNEEFSWSAWGLEKVE